MFVFEMCETAIQTLAQGRQPPTLHAAKGMTQMARQDQEALYEGGDYHADHHRGDILQDVADDAADQHKRQEGSDGREG